MNFIGILVVANLLLRGGSLVVDLEDAQKYLKQYDYIGDESVTDSLTNFKTILANFQERYNLFVDGELNEETLKLMNKPRCEEGEDSFRVRSKWNKTDLIWYFPQATNEKYRELARKAFNFWEEKSNLKFSSVSVPTPIKPDITITIQSRDHFFRANCQGQQKCPKTFDGSGAALAHAYFPDGDKCREIHLDLEESWYFEAEGDVPEGQTSFLMTLTHEIGHALGLSHSDVPTAVMFPWYQDKITSLSSDDIMALEYLYGAKGGTSTVPSTTVPTPTIPSTTNTKAAVVSSNPKNEGDDRNSTHEHIGKNMCELSHPNITFIANAPQFPNHRLYVVSNDLLWRIDVKNTKLSVSENLRSYLPKELTKVTHVFQDTTGNLFVVNENRFYLVSFPDLTIRKNIEINLPENSKINAVFQTNTGQNFIWYNNASFIEFSMDNFQIRNRGLIRDNFPGIPEDISSALRYIDGHIYFFRYDTYYKYNEFKKQLIEAGPFNWNILGISCPNKGLLEQLKSTLTRIIKLYE